LQKYSNINSKLYAHLFQEGGDSLIAVYALLKSAKRINGKVIKEQNRNIYHTLKTETNLSISTLRKYIKVLTKLNLCYFDSIGNFCLVGANKINKEFKTRKYVKVETGTFSQTKLYSFRVRVFKMEKQQKKAIDRKLKQTNIIARQSKGYYTSPKERSFLKLCESKTKTVDYHTAKTILSNQGFSKLKHGEERSKSSGYFWKKKLVKAKIIQVTRRFKYLRKGTILDYLENRKFDRTVTYKNGKIFKEIVPEFTTDIKDKVIYKKKSYLQFDMIDFWINGGK
jgi:hypothetical protein